MVSHRSFARILSLACVIAFGGCTDGGSPTPEPEPEDLCADVVCSSDDACVASTCDPDTGACVEAPVAEGAACDDSNGCTTGETCRSGSCGAPTATVTCAALDQCHSAGVCDPGTGLCSNPAVADATACDDASVCTTGETCQAGVCGTPATTVTCTALDACHDVGVCDPGTGVCSEPAKADATACDDGDACTSGESCQAGVCGAPATTVVCLALDPCHDAGVCDPADGVCSNPAKADSTTCSDGNGCTLGETCQAGVCGAHTSTVTCSASDQCHDAGVCDPGTGTCSDPAKADATACDDGSACTYGETCQAGNCGTPTVTITCTASDQCHDAGVCDPATSVCSDPEKADDSACDDGDACTGGETCTAGVCGTPATTVTCAALDSCHDAGVCDSGTGVCSHPEKSDTSACDDGDACTDGESCTAGVCGTPTTTVTCSALDACHVPGVCDPGTGVCSNPPGANSSPCDADSNLCTHDHCMAGACIPTGVDVTCDAPNACQTAGGSCVPATGLCAYPSVPDDTFCDDGTECTQLDTCQLGVCRGSEPVVCGGPIACSIPGVCSPSCGDGVLAANEACDYGPDLPDDTCDAQCNLTGEWSMPYASSYDVSGIGSVFVATNTNDAIVGQCFRPDGTGRRGEFVIASAHLAPWRAPLVFTARDAGTTLVAWKTVPDAAVDLAYVTSQLFDAQCQPIGAPLAWPGGASPGLETFDADIDPQGNFVILRAKPPVAPRTTPSTWIGFYDAQGQPRGADLLVEDEGFCHDSAASYYGMRVVVNASGAGVVTCQGHQSVPIRYRRFDANRAWLDPAMVVVPGTDSNQSSWYSSHTVGIRDDGSFAIASQNYATMEDRLSFFASDGTFLRNVAYGRTTGFLNDGYRYVRDRVEVLGDDYVVRTTYSPVGTDYPLTFFRYRDDGTLLGCDRRTEIDYDVRVVGDVIYGGTWNTVDRNPLDLSGFDGCTPPE